jgi:alpha/beta superfamily hydrolase
MAQDYTGSWHGKADMGAMSLRITFHVESIDNGLSATMDSPDQDAFDIPTDTTFVSDDKLVIEVRHLGLIFEGQLHDDGEILIGNINQMGRGFPVEFSHEPIAEEKLNRPQEPKPPFDYVIREVTFENKEVEINLAGTLTLPNGEGPFPAVVLISGSGPQDRNEEILKHKPFWVIADHFANNGIAVLRYDDRGIAESEGDFSMATSEDFAADALAAIDFLKRQKKIDKNSTGLAGHSEGGLVAAMAAAQSESVNFVISLAGTGVSGAEVLITQIEDIALAEGTPESAVEASLAEQRMIIDAIDEADNYKEARKVLPSVLDTIMARSSQEVPNAESLSQQTIDQYGSPWMHFFINYDPADSWSKIENTPVLAINGTNDLQVEAGQNLKAIENSLKEAGNKDVTTMKIHGLNHLFQQSSTGKISEYGKIEETFNVSVLKLMTEWIHDRF